MPMYRDRYAVILVHSTSHAIRAEKLLHQAGIESKLIPVPRHLSSDCGVCLRIERADVEQARQTLEDSRMEIGGVHEI
jgi:hypothetical protein